MYSTAFWYSKMCLVSLLYRTTSYCTAVDGRMVEGFNFTINLLKLIWQLQILTFNTMNKQCETTIDVITICFNSLR